MMTKLVKLSFYLVIGAFSIALYLWVTVHLGYSELDKYAPYIIGIPLAVIFMFFDKNIDSKINKYINRNASKFTVYCTEEGITCIGPNSTETVSWENISEVLVDNVDEYPIGCQNWVFIDNSNTGCVVPSDANGAKNLLDNMLTKLSDFNHRAFIEAMGNVDGSTVVWKKT